MKSKLFNYLDFNEVFFNYQFGFRHYHSATDIVDNLYKNQENTIKSLVFI